MFKLIDDILNEFQISFKRVETFSWFTIIVLGMLVRVDFKGLTTIIGYLNLDPKYYESMIHFFRSRAYNLTDLKRQWANIVTKRIDPVKICGKQILIADHTKVAKEARHMPGVKKHHQDSENVGKAEYIYGHQFGMLGILARGKTNQCIPLDIGIHDGINEITELEEEPSNWESNEWKETCIIKIIRMAGNYVTQRLEETILLLDAYFPSADIFNYAEKINKEIGMKAITLIMRAKANTVAFEELEKENKIKGRGRPRKNGKKVEFKNIFKNMLNLFETVTLNIYGKKEILQYYCIDLIWKPIAKKARFVLVKTGGKTMILMCSDLSLDPEQIIIAYSYRFKIEVSFKVLKRVIGGFCYHFWTSAMPKLSRFKTSADISTVIETNDKKRIIFTVRAIEVFTFLNCIAIGILMILSLDYTVLIWKKFSGWLRTKSSDIPSVETVRHALRQELLWNFRKLSKYATLSKIQKYQRINFDEEYERAG